VLGESGCGKRGAQHQGGGAQGHRTHRDLLGRPGNRAEAAILPQCATAFRRRGQMKRAMRVSTSEMRRVVAMGR
jgi:hypothetical protein